MRTPDELKRSHMQTENWKRLPPEIKDQLRDSWKTLDSACKAKGGYPRLFKSKIDPGLYIKGCAFEQMEQISDQNFREIVKITEQQIQKQETNYAVQLLGVEDLIYETNNDQHFIELTHHENFERDTFEYTITKIHDTQAHHRQDDYMPSYIDEFLLRFHRFYQTREEHKIKELIKLSNEILQNNPTEENHDWYIIKSATANQLATKVKEHFE